eukprot:scaffold1427_cov63-Cylindrotheca_fusiformis.AAC.5
MAGILKSYKPDSSSTILTMDESVASANGGSGSSGSEPAAPPPPFGSPACSVSEKGCYRALQSFCETSNISMSDETIFRYACFHGFNLEKAQRAIVENRDNHYLQLKMTGSLLKQFETSTIFPLPGLKTKKGKCDVVYMRPSRYVPSEHNEHDSKNTTILENLCYVLNDLSDTPESCQNGLAFVANMKSFTTKHYEESYWIQLIQALQGKYVPIRINLFLIVNPPTWFGKVWNLAMKPTLSNAFIKTVHIVDSEEELFEYLSPGYEAFLPEELATVGWRSTSEIVEDYIDRKVFEDNAHDDEDSHAASSSSIQHHHRIIQRDHLKNSFHQSSVKPSRA